MASQVTSQLPPAPVPGPAAADSPSPTRETGGPRPWLPALLTGGLLWLCYFPVAIGWLAWVALVPLLCLVRLPRRRFRYLAAYVGGLVFYAPATQWMRVADPRMYATWLGLTIYCALYFPLAIFLLRLIDRHTRLPMTFAVPVVWTALELLRTNFGGGFGWYLLGHTQHDILYVIQVADLAGAYGVTFLVAAVNGLVFELLGAWGPFRRWVAGPATQAASAWWLLPQVLAVAALLGGALGYGTWRLGQDQFADGPLVALIQGNLDQRIRNEAAVDASTASGVMDHYVFLTDLLLRTRRPDLVVWPETACPFFWTESSAGRPDPATQNLGRLLATRWKMPVLVGLNAEVGGAEKDRPRRYNSTVLVGTDGKAHGRYDKVHRVPFGEYVPFRDWLPVMDRLAPYDFDYGVEPGESFTRFRVDAKEGRRGSTFGVLICYEDTDPGVSRSYGGGGGEPPAGFVLNVSNDGWFDGTSEHDEHLAICRFRAVENRRAVCRSVNMGISAVIDPNGRVLAPRPLPLPEGTRAPEGTRLWFAEARPGSPGLPARQWGEYKKVPGVVLAVVPLDDRTSLYARWGDWLPWLCWAVVAVAAARAGWRRSHSRRAPAVQTSTNGPDASR
jgi:apolipoprotein N-acyltransferase